MLLASVRGEHGFIVGACHGQKSVMWHIFQNGLGATDDLYFVADSILIEALETVCGSQGREHCASCFCNVPLPESISQYFFVTA
ncbi:hypothetical protein VTL71DRAFT_4473, partial [Oculimacula yallundae]